MDGHLVIQHMSVQSHVTMESNFLQHRIMDWECHMEQGPLYRHLAANKNQIRSRGNHAVITHFGFQNFGCQSSFLIGPAGIAGHSAVPHVDRDNKLDHVSVQTIEIVLENRLKLGRVNSPNVPDQNGRNGVNGQCVRPLVIMERQAEREHVRSKLDVPVKVPFEHHMPPSGHQKVCIFELIINFIEFRKAS